MPVVPFIPAIIGAAGAVGSAVLAKKSSDKAIQAQKDAAAAGKVDIDALNDQTKRIATQNAIDSQALERQLTPEVAGLRTQANQGMLDFLQKGEDPGLAKGRQLIESNLGVPLDTPLLNSAIAKAQSDLALGGRLGADQQNFATRKAGAAAGSVAGPGGGLGLGRDLTARDLGLTSFQVEQQRLQNASQLGGQELTKATDNQSNLYNNLQLLRSLHDTRFNQYLQAGQYTNSIARPVVGLDPGSAANLSVGNSALAANSIANQGNLAAAGGNNTASAFGQLAGYGLQAWNARTPSNNGYSTDKTTYVNPDYANIYGRGGYQ